MTTNKHRYVTIDGKLYQITENNRKRFLEAARDMASTDIEMDPAFYRMTLVSDHPVEDWNNMTSAMAQTLLEGAPLEEAETVAETQAAIETDQPLPPET